MPNKTSTIEQDANSRPVPLMELFAPQNGLTNVASATIVRDFVRLQATVDSYVLFSPAGTVCTSVTGHFLGQGGVYDLPVGNGNTKVYILGTCHLSELG